MNAKVKKIQEWKYIDKKIIHLRALLMLCTIGALVITATVSKVAHQAPPLQAAHKGSQCDMCHSRRQALVAYFKRAGNPTPYEMTQAVLKVKPENSRTMAAIAVAGERNTPYTVRHGGYRGAHAGAWQVNERMHRQAYGPVPHDVVGQALQAERLLTGSQDMPIKKALSIYGGDSTGKDYQKRVLSELVRVP